MSRTDVFSRAEGVSLAEGAGWRAIARWVIAWYPEIVICGILAFLPLQALVLTHAPSWGALAVRYGPELLAIVLLVVLAIARRPVLGIDALWVALPLAAVVAYWALTALVNDVSLRTAVVGMRSELRFLSLLAIPLFLRAIERDAILFARVIVGGAVLQAALVMIELVGGSPVRSALTPSYTLTVGGVTVGQAQAGPCAIVGTFDHRNLLGPFLAFAFVILIAAGRRLLARPPWALWVIGALLLLAVVVSGSRQGIVAAVVGGLAVSILRRWTRVLWLALAVAILIVVGGILAAQLTHPTAADREGFVAHWSYAFTTSAWTPEEGTNLRLFLLKTTVDQTAHKSPAFGYGLGTASDPKLLGGDYKSPIYDHFRGREPYISSFIYDNNWASLLLEVGFVGVALAALLFMAVIRTGVRVARVHWIGDAAASLAVAIAVLGFFGPSLQARIPNAFLWLFVGLALAYLCAPRPKARIDAAGRPTALRFG
jgi:O-Antigen ligase